MAKQDTDKRLIYPLISARGPNGTDGSIKADSRFPSQALDFLKFTIYDPEKANPYNYVNTGSGFAGNKFSKNQDAILKTIYLYLPHELNESYATNYDKVALGPFGDALVSAVAQGSVEGIENKLSTAAAAAKPEVAFSAIAGAFNGAMSLAGISGNLDKDALTALSKQKIFNPYQETVFKGVNYRSHTFNFDLAPRNAREVDEIKKIIQSFRQAMLPGVNGETGGGGKTDRWLTIPRFFRVEVVRYKPGDTDSDEKMKRPETLNYVMRFPVKMVLVDMQLNLTPDGQNNTLRAPKLGDMTDYGPAHYRMSLRFDETAFLTREMFDDNASRDVAARD